MQLFKGIAACSKSCAVMSSSLSHCTKSCIVHVESLSNEDQNATSVISCLTFSLKIKVFVFYLVKDKLSQLLWAG